MVRFWKGKIKPPVHIRAEDEEAKEKEEAAEIQPAKRSKTLGRVLGRMKQSVSTIPADQRALMEITSYLQKKVFDGDDKPLKW